MLCLLVVPPEVMRTHGSSRKHNEEIPEKKGVYGWHMDKWEGISQGYLYVKNIKAFIWPTRWHEKAIVSPELKTYKEFM